MRAAIFVVDDQLNVANATAAMMRSWGHEVTVETSGTRALQILLGPAEFDVTFLDILMPDMTGGVIYNALKDRKSARLKRLVFLTGMAYMVEQWLERTGLLVIQKGGADVPQKLARTVQEFAQLSCSRGPYDMPKQPSKPDLAELLDDDDIEVDTGMIELAHKRGASREIITELRIRHLHSSHKSLTGDVAAVKTDVGAVKTDVGAVKTDVSAVKTDLGTLKTEITTTIKTSTKWIAAIIVFGGLVAWLVEHIVFKK